MKAKSLNLYWGFIRRLPCLVCYDAFYTWLLAQDPDVQNGIMAMVDVLQESSNVQRTPTEVAHLGLSTSRRGISQKYPAAEVGPLCGDHHQLAGDSHHAGTATFWAKHPLLDRDGLQKMLLAIFESTPMEVFL